jgi:hypothetical protein
VDRRSFLKSAASLAVAAVAAPAVALGGHVPNMICAVDLAGSPDKTFAYVAELGGDGLWRLIDGGEVISDVDAYMGNMHAVIDAAKAA